MTGSFSWDNANIVLNKKEENLYDEITMLIDEGAVFELTCKGGIVMVISSDTGVWKSFHVA